MSGGENTPRPSDFPRLADAYNGDGFPEHGPWTPLSAAVLRDALDALKESREPDAAADAVIGDALDAIRQRYRRAGNSSDIQVNLDSYIDSANDVPCLLAALDEVLKLAGDLAASGTPALEKDRALVRAECAAWVREAIASVLLGEKPDENSLKLTAQAQTRAAKEIEAAWHDPHWPGGS